MSESRPDSPEMLERRELLRRAAWLLGGAISAPAALAFLQACSRKESVEAKVWVSQVLSAAEMEVISVVADIMIPKTDTAGALDAEVPQFIDRALGALYPKRDQNGFKAGLADFAESVKNPGKPFLARDRAEQETLVKQAIDAALVAAQDPFILTLRELTLLGYFSSRVGITENMEYVSVPTAYHGCVPLTQMKKHVYWE